MESVPDTHPLGAWLLSVFWKERVALVVVGAVVLAHFGVLRLATRYDSGDVGGLQFMESVWLAPRGVTVDFRGP